MSLEDVPFVVADTEDNTPELIKEKRSLFDKAITQIAAIGRTGERVWFDRPEKFLSWLCKQTRDGQNLRCYFHNTQYDLGAFFADKLDHLDSLLVGGRLIRSRWQGIEFRDSASIWPMRVEKIGETIGLKKLKMDIRSKEYAMRDVEIVRKAMVLAYRIAEDHGVEAKAFPSTLGGLCVKIWHAMGGQNVQNCWKLARQAYYGGRVELFNRGGTGHIPYTDINSLYPSVMLQPFPNSWEQMDGFDKGWGVARVRIEIPKCRIAPLPVRREDGCIWFPWGVVDGDEPETKDGYRNGVWTFHEIRNAVKHGAKVTHVYEAFGSESAEYYYRDFVHEFYEKRNATDDEGLRTFYKLLMNNLYGQLAMSGMVTRTLDAMKFAARDNYGKPVVRNGNYVIQMEADRHPHLFGTKIMCDCLMPLPEHVNYLHGAYVTSYARLALQDHLRMVPADDLIYCDTDSIMFYHDPKRRMPFPVGRELGQMKMVGVADRVQIHAPKVYEVNMNGETEYKAKGVPKREIEEKPGVTYAEEFIKTGRTSFYQPYKMRESIAFYDRMKTGQSDKKLSIWREVEKRTQTSYDKKTERNGMFFPKKNVDA